VGFRTLRAFVEVVRQGGFSQAAKTVFATQSTVSKAVKQLEDEIGVPLLDRIGHRTRLTDAGAIVYPRAVCLLTDRDDLVAELDELRGLERGMPKLGLPGVGSTIMFAPFFAIYRNRYPGIDIRLVEHGGERLEELLVRRDRAWGLRPAGFEGLQWQEIRREPLVALLPIQHALSGRPSVNPVSRRSRPRSPPEL
jgi:DNA-binding transcriptional LysR family regulator